MFHFLVYCVKLLIYCLPTLAYTRLAAASGCLHTCSLPKPRTSTVVALPCCKTPAAARCAVHLLSTDVYAKCHILYLSCLNCSSSLFYVLLYYGGGGSGATVAAAGGGPPSPSQPHVISQFFFVEFLIMHTRWSHIYLKAALFLHCACFFKFHPHLFFEKKKITIELHLLPV